MTNEIYKYIYIVIMSALIEKFNIERERERERDKEKELRLSFDLVINKM